MMKIIFFGSSHFALPSFKALASSGYQISCVVTQPDRARGRGLHIGETLVKKLDEELRVPIHQPEAVNSPASLKFLKAFKPDLFVVIAYGQILSSEALSIPKLSINLHASLLPRYRGAAPINWAVINGEKESGISVMKMTEKMDAGGVILQKSFPIGREDTAVSLEEKLSLEGSFLLLEAIRQIESGSYKEKPQDKKEVSFAPKLRKSDGLIDWSRSAEEIDNLVRGSLPWPGAFTHYKGRLLKIYRAEPFLGLDRSAGGEPGEVVKVLKDGICVATGNGELVIKELQPEAKRRMSASEFIRGHKISAGEIFTKK